MLLIFISVCTRAQSSLQPDPHLRSVKDAPVFVDSVELDKGHSILNFIETSEIADIKVIGPGEKFKNGAMYIMLKDPGLLNRLMQEKQLSLMEIMKAKVTPEEVTRPVVYILNDKIVTDTAGIRTPASRVYNVDVIRASETAYFKTAFPSALIVNISTHPPKIYIR